MSVKVQKICPPVELGEGPHWDERTQALYFVCIKRKEIHKYVPSTGKHTKTTVDGMIGFIVPLESCTDQFVVGVERKFLIIKWDGEDGSKAQVVKELAAVDENEPGNRINDGKCDPRGRLFAGTMGPKDPAGNRIPGKANLFRLDGPKISTIDTGIGISNGLAWDLEQRAFYYTDSLERDIRRYDYDVATGDISNQRHIFSFEANMLEGLVLPKKGVVLPDGTTIDTNGNLWVAVFNGGCLLNIDPRTGKLLKQIPMPAKQVTSSTFGGPNLDTLFVTTADVNHEGGEGGSTYMITGLGVKGLRNVPFKI